MIVNRDLLFRAASCDDVWKMESLGLCAAGAAVLCPVRRSPGRSARKALLQVKRAVLPEILLLEPCPKKDTSCRYRSHKRRGNEKVRRTSTGNRNRCYRGSSLNGRRSRTIGKRPSLTTVLKMLDYQNPDR